MTALVTENLALLSGAPAGIQQLRTLIRRLAVTGRLLPAEVNSAPSIHWQSASFGEIFALEYGKNLPGPKRSGTGEFPVYGSNGVVGSHVECCVDTPCLVIGRKGSAGAVNLCEHDGCWVTDVAYSCVPPDNVTLQFAHLLFLTLGLDELGKGIKPGLSRNEANVLRVNIPPLPEQHRIVAKVDELMALCDRLEAQQADAEAAHALLVKALLASLTQARDAADFRASWQQLSAHFHTLFTTEASIEALKQAVLQLGVMGKLVAQNSGDEPAAVTLAKIASKQNVKISKTLSPLIAADGTFDLPSGWIWSKLGAEVMASGAGWSPSCETRRREGDEWGVLKVSAVSWTVYRPDENKALPANLPPQPEHEVHAGDFLVSRANTEELVARSVVVEATPPHLMLSDKIVRLKFSPLSDVRYMNLVNSAPHARRYYSLVAGGTSSSMKNVTREQILNLPVPLPPLAEQHRIVAKVDELLALCDQLKLGLAQARQHHAHLAAVLVEQAVAT